MLRKNTGIDRNLKILNLYAKQNIKVRQISEIFNLSKHRIYQIIKKAQNFKRVSSPKLRYFQRLKITQPFKPLLKQPAILKPVKFPVSCFEVKKYLNPPKTKRPIPCWCLVCSAVKRCFPEATELVAQIHSIWQTGKLVNPP